MDKKLNEVTKVTDMAYVPVIMSDGSIGQIAKSDLASVVAGVLTSAIFTLQPGGEYDFNISGGIVAIATNAIQNGAAILSFPFYGNNAAYLLAGTDTYVVGNVTTPNKIAFWRSEDGKCHIRNNFSSVFAFYYNILCKKS